MQNPCSHQQFPWTYFSSWSQTAQRYSCWLLQNALSSSDPKFRRVRQQNAAFQARLGRFPEALEVISRHQQRLTLMPCSSHAHTLFVTFYLQRFKRALLHGSRHLIKL